MKSKSKVGEGVKTMFLSEARKQFGKAVMPGDFEYKYEVYSSYGPLVLPNENRSYKYAQHLKYETLKLLVVDDSFYDHGQGD